MHQHQKSTLMAVVLTASMALNSAIAGHIPDNILEIATKTIADPHASKTSLENAKIIMQSNGHTHGIYRQPYTAEIAPVIPSNPFYYQPKKAISNPTPTPAVKKPLPEVKQELATLKNTNHQSVSNGMYQDVSAMTVVRDLTPVGWEIKLEGTKAKLSSTRINYYTEKSNMESINEIIYGIGLKMKVFRQLKLIIVTN